MLSPLTVHNNARYNIMFINKRIAVIGLTALIASCSCFETKPKSGITFSTVDEVARVVAEPSSSTAVLDANPDAVRNTKGVIPTAIKLSSYDAYSLSELPVDKNTALIFYCYNEACAASTEAANRALNNGWAKVSVMKAGIIGWNAQQKK